MEIWHRVLGVEAVFFATPNLLYASCFSKPVSRSLFHVFEGDGILLRFTFSAPDSTGDGNGLIFILAGAIGVDDIGHFLCVCFADGATTKFTGGVSRSFTMPTFHNLLG